MNHIEKSDATKRVKDRDVRHKSTIWSRFLPLATLAIVSCLSNPVPKPSIHPLDLRQTPIEEVQEDAEEAQEIIPPKDIPKPPKKDVIQLVEVEENFEEISDAKPSSEVEDAPLVDTEPDLPMLKDVQETGSDIEKPCVETEESTHFVMPFEPWQKHEAVDDCKYVMLENSPTQGMQLLLYCYDPKCAESTDDVGFITNLLVLGKSGYFDKPLYFGYNGWLYRIQVELTTDGSSMTMKFDKYAPVN